MIGNVSFQNPRSKIEEHSKSGQCFACSKRTRRHWNVALFARFDHESRASDIEAISREWVSRTLVRCHIEIEEVEGTAQTKYGWIGGAQATNWGADGATQVRKEQLAGVQFWIPFLIFGSPFRIVLADALRLSTVDGQEAQRSTLLWNLTEIVQNRISFLQNPADCRGARKLVCQLNKGCGFGCQLHHVAYCLIVAYGSRRTMVLDSRGWRYSQRGWDSIFLPVSSNCRNFTEDLNAESWRGKFLLNLWDGSLKIR